MHPVPMLRATVLALTLSMASPAVAAEPAAQLRAHLDQFFKIVTDQQASPVVERRAAVRAVAEEMFDFGEAAKRVLGPHWVARTPDEQVRFVRAFTDLIDCVYLRKVEGYGAASDRVVLTGERVTGDDAIVSADISAADGDRIPINFVMLRATDGRWRTWDVRIGPMSLVATYRAQVAKILRTASYGELLRRLDVKVQEASATSR